MAEGSEVEISTALAEGVAKKDPEVADQYGYEVEADCLRTVIVQMRALGLIVPGKKQRDVNSSYIYWSLTPYGDAVMTRLRAIPSGVSL